MPLLLTPAAPLRLASLLEVLNVYVIIDEVRFSRKRRTASFTLGYYANEPACLPDAGAEVDVNLPRGFSLTMTPAQAAQVGNPEEILEAYAANELLTLLPGATIETVA